MRLLSWIVMVPLALVVIAFSVANRTPVVLDLWPLDIPIPPLPLFALVLAGALAGFVAGGLIAWVSAGGVRRRARQLARRAEEAERQLERLREKMDQMEEGAENSQAVPPTPVPAPRARVDAA